jgi:hypothetical protein
MRILDIYSMSDEDLLGLAGQIIENIQSSDLIRDRMAQVNIGEDHLEQGQAVLDAFRPLVRAVPDLAGEAAATIQNRDDVTTSFRAGLLRRHVQTARLVFRDRPDVQEQLRLSRALDTSQSLDEFLEGAATFYDRLDGEGDLRTQMAERGYTDAAHAEARSAIEAITAADQAYSRLVAERQQAVRSRDAFRPRLIDWIRETQRWAQIVLDDQPDLLEQLGFVVPSR